MLTNDDINGMEPSKLRHMSAKIGLKTKGSPNELKERLKYYTQKHLSGAYENDYEFYSKEYYCCGNYDGKNSCGECNENAREICLEASIERLSWQLPSIDKVKEIIADGEFRNELYDNLMETTVVPKLFYIKHSNRIVEYYIEELILKQNVNLKDENKWLGSHELRKHVNKRLKRLNQKTIGAPHFYHSIIPYLALNLNLLKIKTTPGRTVVRFNEDTLIPFVYYLASYFKEFKKIPDVGVPK